MSAELRTRLVARLDVKAPNLIKGVQMEGLRVLGNPFEFACTYYEQGIDEIIYMDVVASLYNRNSLTDLIKRTAADVFVPLTVGGGIRSVEDAREILRAGADKVAVNTAALRQPDLITQIAQQFGAQCMVLSIEAKRTKAGWWEALMDSGREHSGRDAIEWAKEGAKLGAGEILVTSVDRDGTRRGFDTDIIRAISESVAVPVIASGGFGLPQHAVEAVRLGGASAVAIADALHYRRCSLRDIRECCKLNGILVR